MTLPNKRSALVPHGGEVGIFLACVASAVAALWGLGWMQRRQDELDTAARMTQPQAHPATVNVGGKASDKAVLAQHIGDAVDRARRSGRWPL